MTERGRLRYKPRARSVIDRSAATERRTGTFCLAEVACKLSKRFSIAEFQTVGAREIPGRSSYWNPGFPEGRPGVPAATGRLRIRRAGSLSRYS